MNPFLSSSLALAILLVAFFGGETSGFVLVPTLSSSSSSTPTTSTWLHQQHSIQAAGCGVPIVPTGHRLLFDPSQQGMLGTVPENLDQRILHGSSYIYLPEHQGPSSSLYSLEDGGRKGEGDETYKGFSP